MVFSIIRLIRFEKSFLSAFSIFLPALQKTKDVRLSLAYSIPIFTIMASAFIINDINDIERDFVNNPDRVLPQKLISTDFAITLYYFLLLLTLVIVKFLIPFNHVFLFMFYLILATNYNYLVNSFPYLKNFYVVLIMIAHLSIIFLLVPVNLFFSGCILLNILSEEVLLDLRDLKGDGNTLPKIVGKKVMIRVAALLQLLQLALLIAYGKFNFVHLSVILLTVSTQALLYFFWKQQQNRLVIWTLKAQTIMMFALLILFT
jgi:geranylgeranylglycerol-phosphate geranylgeranyltransferase